MSGFFEMLPAATQANYLAGLQARHAASAAALGLTVEAYLKQRDELIRQELAAQVHCDACQLCHDIDFDCAPGVFSRYRGDE